MSAVEFDSNHRVYHFEPFGWQEPFVRSTANEVLGSGAFGSGKTRAGCEKVAVHCRFPGNHVLICRRTHTSLLDTTLRTLTEEVLPESWILDHNKGLNKFLVRSPDFPAAYCRNCDWDTFREVEEPQTHPCPKCDEYQVEAVPPAEISYKGLNTAAPGRDMPSNILSMNLGAVYIDEAVEIEEKHYMLLAGRLRLNRLRNPYVPELPIRQIFATTNPASPNHFLYKRFYPPEAGEREVYESETEDNPHNPGDYVERLKGQYTGTMADRYIKGQWVGYEGRIYDEFDETLHVVSPLDVPDLFGEGWTVHNEDALREWRNEYSDPIGDPDSKTYQPAVITPPDDARIVMSIDWGYRPDPTVVGWFVDDPEFGYIMYREFFQTRQLPGQVAKTCLSWMGPNEVTNVSRVFADHDSGNREDWMRGLREWLDEQRSRDRDVTGYDVAHLRTTAAIKEWEKGFNLVKRLLDVDENDRAELYFIKGARRHQADQHLLDRQVPTTTRTELRQYGWAAGDSEEPQEDNDHGPDMVRYMAATDAWSDRGGGSWDTTVHKS